MTLDSPLGFFSYPCKTPLSLVDFSLVIPLSINPPHLVFVLLPPSLLVFLRRIGQQQDVGLRAS